MFIVGCVVPPIKECLFRRVTKKWVFGFAGFSTKTAQHFSKKTAWKWDENQINLVRLDQNIYLTIFFITRDSVRPKNRSGTASTV